MQRGKYFIAGKMPKEGYNHFAYNLDVYTHFTNPTRRYPDCVVQRQLAAALAAGEEGTPEFAEDIDSVAKVAEMANWRKDSAKNAQEQSIHLHLCRAIDQKRQELGGEIICEAIVLTVYESAFDVLIPEYGFEKRVHCDQIPLKKAEFDKEKRVLELYWEKGVQSNVYIPEDERPKGIAAIRAAANAQAAANQAAAEKAAREQEEAQRRMMEVSSQNPNDEKALFDSDSEDSDPSGSIQEGVAINPPSDNARPTQSMPPSPTGKAAPSSQVLSRTKSDPKLSISAAELKQPQGTQLKEKYGHMFTLREEKGDYIQEVREMTMVPVYLKTDLTKSPP